MIWGSVVVWRDQRNGNYDVYGKDLSTDQELEICVRAGDQTNPEICGDWVTWQDNRNGNDDIYAKNLSTGEEFEVCAASGGQTFPVVSGTRLAWQDQRTAITEIYWYDLQYPACSRTVSEGIYASNTSAVIRNCTLLGCTDYAVSGSESDYSMPTLSGCTIRYGYGGIYGCNGLIEDNVLTNNEIGLVECDGWVLGNTFTYNNVCAIAFCDGEIVNNLVYRNHTGGIVDSDANLINNTIAVNGGDAVVDCAGPIKNNIIAYNEGVGLSGECSNSYNIYWKNDSGAFGSGAIPGPGSVLVNPLFADVEGNDFHLLSTEGRRDPAAGTWVYDGLSSRCIDAGDPADGTGLETNPNGGRINLGAYGGTVEASKSPYGYGPDSPCINPPSMDSNDDCKIDLTDLAAFCAQWLTCGRDDPAACWATEPLVE